MIMRNEGETISEIFANYYHSIHQFSRVSVCVIGQKACIRSSLHIITFLHEHYYWLIMNHRHKLSHIW